jgi:hypothetical protein
VQPVQLSLISEGVPAPLPVLVAQIPEPHVAAAIALLAELIAKAAAAGTGGDQ